MVWRMTGLCLAWGLVVGFLVDVVVNPVASADRFFPPVLPIAFISAMFGLGYGIVSLFLSIPLGNRQITRFKFSLLILVTAIAVTCFPFADNSLFSILIESKRIRLLDLTLSIAHAVSVAGFSQIVARQYLREISTRKRKQKPA